MYSRILYLELDVVNCTPLLPLFCNANFDAKPNACEELEAECKKDFHELFYSNSSKTPAVLISRQDFAYPNDFEPISTSNIVGKEWGMYVNGGVMLLTPSERDWEQAKTIMSRTCPWDSGKKGGIDVLAMSMVFGGSFFSLPAKYNAISSRIVEPSGYRFKAWDAWGDSEFFPYFVHLVGKVHYQDHFANVGCKDNNFKRSFLISKIKESFGAWHAWKREQDEVFNDKLQEDADRRGTIVPQNKFRWTPSFSKFLDTNHERESTRVAINFELGFCKGPQQARDRPTRAEVFDLVSRWHNPFAKLTAVFWHACDCIHSLHMKEGPNDPYLAGVLESAFPCVVSSLRGKSGSSIPILPFMSMQDNTGMRFQTVVPSPHDWAGYSICQQYQQGRCDRTDLQHPWLADGFSTHIWACRCGDSLRLHICACKNCLYVNDYEHVYVRGTCENRSRPRLRVSTIFKKAP